MSFLNLDEIVPKDTPVFLSCTMKFFLVTTVVFILLISSVLIYQAFETLFFRGPWKRSTAGDLEALTKTDINVKVGVTVNGVQAVEQDQREESVPLLKARNTDGIIEFGGLKI